MIKELLDFSMGTTELIGYRELSPFFIRASVKAHDWESLSLVLVPAMECMNQFLSVKSPYQKACIIHATSNLITSAVHRLCREKATGADDVLPLLVAVVLRAQIQNLPSELGFIDDMMMDSVKDGEIGYFLACGHAVLGRILNWSWENLTKR